MSKEEMMFICEDCCEPNRDIRWIGEHGICEDCYNSVASPNDPKFGSLPSTPPFVNLVPGIEICALSLHDIEELFGIKGTARYTRHHERITDGDKAFLKSMHIIW